MITVCPSCGESTQIEQNKKYFLICGDYGQFKALEVLLPCLTSTVVKLCLAADFCRTVGEFSDYVVIGVGKPAEVVAAIQEYWLNYQNDDGLVGFDHPAGCHELMDFLPKSVEND